MVQRVSIDLVCDFCADESGGGEPPATETFEVAITGPTYVIDLCDKHAAAMYELRGLIQAVGRTERRGVRREKPRPFNPNTKDVRRRRTQQLQRVRSWARENGYKVSNARIPYNVQRAYNAAHPDDQVALADGGRGAASGE